MGIGGGIVLLVIGAILAFAVRDSVKGVDLGMIGYICMAAGALALLLSLIMNAQRSRSRHEVVERRPDAPAESGHREVRDDGYDSRDVRDERR